MRAEHKKFEKPVIYVDFDNTLVDTNAAITKLYDEDFKYYSKYQKIDPDKIDTYNFDELNCASQEIINYYFNTQRLFDAMTFFNNAKAVLEILHIYGFKVVVVSHGYRPNAVLKEQFLKEHLPFVEFKWVDLKHHEDKSCVDMSDGIFIDDVDNNLQFSNAKYKICFGRVMSCNRDTSFRRCLTWEQVFNMLRKEFCVIWLQ